MEEAKRNSSHLVIDAREGFFHAMLSYRVSTDADLVTKIHDKLHLLAPTAGKSVSQANHLLESPFPEGFNRDDSVLNSSLYVFLDVYCLKDGMGWEGDGAAKSGGFVGAVRLSPVFVPIFSATEIVPENTESAQKGSGKGSIGQMIKLTHEDMQDNVLLELIIARELHLISKKSSKTGSKKALTPCSYIFPLFRQDIWKCGAASSLPKTASALTNAKAKKVMKQMDIPDEVISEELRNETLTVHAVWEFFTQFQGIKLYDRGEERFQVAAAANAIIGVIDEVKNIVYASKFHDLKMNSSQLYELSGFMSQLNMSNYSPILAIHHISNVFQFAQLNQIRADAIVQSIAEYGVRASDKSTMPVELLKVESAIQAAQSSPLAKPLNVRFENFIDQNASFATMISSSCLLDIALSKKLSWIIIAPSMIVMALINMSNTFLDNPTFFRNNRSLSLAHYSLSVAGYLILALIACPVAFLKSPRHSRFCVAAAVLVFAIIYTVDFAVSVHSAIYSSCVDCAAQTLETFSVFQKIVSQPMIGVVFWAALFCILFKQQYLVRICLTLLIVLNIPPVVILSTAKLSVGSSNFLIQLIFWTMLYVAFKILQFIGNRRASFILNLNANITETVFEKMRTSNPFASSGPEPTTTCLFGWCKNRRDISHSRITMGAPREELNSVLSAGVPAQSTGYVDIHSLFPKQNIGKSQMLQQHDSFESLIRDAEFINLSFQEWVSSWLSNGPHLDKVQSLLCRSDAGVHQSLSSLSSNNPALPIHGTHLRGPVKRLDRSIEKVFATIAALLPMMQGIFFSIQF
jgi:hypothetical protein